MNIELLFKERKNIGSNILNIIKDNGYTKSSFSKLIKITRPTLDKLISGEIDSLTKFKHYIEMIKEAQDMDEKQIMNYILKTNVTSEPVFLYSFNTPEEYIISENAKKAFSLLDDVLQICEIYCRQG
jgi:predicted XRE-type DNA-binding protein